MTDTNISSEQKSLNNRVRGAKTSSWIKFSIIVLLIIAFVVWTGYYLVLLLIPLLFDSYILKYIPWTFWKKSKNKAFRTVMSWIDAIGFALIAVWVINTFFFQNYQIPSSSLEKTLLVGDFLLVNKMSYGTRSPMTPLSFPLAQHTMPILNCKSYIDKPQLKYQRFSGFGSIERDDIVVFNYPSGDTVFLSTPSDYYILCASEGRSRALAKFGKTAYRPVDRRENFVKRCIGLPGDTIKLIDNVVFINGKRTTKPKDMQLMYSVQVEGNPFNQKLLDELGISIEDLQTSEPDNCMSKFITFNPNYVVGSRASAADTIWLQEQGFVLRNGIFGTSYSLPLTDKMLNTLKNKPYVISIVELKDPLIYKYFTYPLNFNTGWSTANYGPLWIPKKGSTIYFDNDIDFKVATYGRVIKNYEGNLFEYKNGEVYINGLLVHEYTFKLDYYFMMGDNRDKSSDSRSWGFVPEDHIVGKPMFIWLSLNKDKSLFNGKIRWGRLFTSAKKN